jgi:hypothetical protein
MSKIIFVLATCTALFAVSPAPAQGLPLRFVTADGTWDCKDPAGANAGTFVMANETYAFIKTDGRLGGYGTLYLIAEDTNTPKFAVLDGYFKDEFGGQGLSLTGPEGDTENLMGELYLFAVVSADNALNWYCTRRKAPE